MGFSFQSNKRLIAGVLFCSAALTACATPDPDAAFDDLNQVVAGRLPDAVVWRTGGPEDAAVDARVAALLSEPLSAQSAVQVALLSNRGLQSRYATLGIAQAEVVQAGLLENPLFEIMVRPSTEVGTNIELGLMQNFVDLLMRPARQKLATAEYEAVKLDLAGELIAFMGEVQQSYHAYRGARGLRDVTDEIADTARDSADLAQSFHTAGNITDLENTAHQAAAEDAYTEILEAEGEVNERRIALAEHLGIRQDGDWSVPARPPSLPEETVRLDGLEDRALRNRFDLAAHRAEVQAAMAGLGLEQDFRLVDEAELSVTGEREPDGAWLIGPGLTLPLPLFDQGQAKVTTAVLHVRRVVDELAEKEAHVCAEVGRAADALALARRRATHLSQTVLPLKERIVRLSLAEYNFMLQGPFHLIEAQQELNESRRMYVETLAEYWISRAELRAATGGSTLDTDPAGPTSGDAS